MASEKQERPVYWRETQHSMLRRCQNWDYSQPAIYMITLVLEDRHSQALGRVVAEDAAAPETAYCELTELGKAVARCWETIPRYYPQIKILAKQVMPDHFHGILWVKEPLKCHLGQVIKGFKIGCNRAWREGSSVVCDNIADNGTLADNRTLADNGTRSAAKGESAREESAREESAMISQITVLSQKTGLSQITGLSPKTGLSQKTGLGRATGRGLFAEGFQDRILFREGQLAAMIKYLHENPLRLAQKRASPELFTLHREVAVALGSEGTGRFAAIGNLDLLNRPMAQVQCSRKWLRYRRVPKTGGGLKILRDETGAPVIESAAPEFEERRDELLQAARHGVVPLSPCVSDGEREIARLMLNAGLPLVTMQNKGFSKLQKPAGRYFEACKAGRLLMLAPARWPYVPGEKPMTRDDATAMNRLCQWIAGEGAAEINYHGMRPVNIDAMARAVVGEGDPRWGRSAMVSRITGLAEHRTR